MTLRLLGGLWADAGGALRTLRAARGFIGIAVATLGTGIALCVTVLTVLNAYLIFLRQGGVVLVGGVAGSGIGDRGSGIRHQGL